MPMPTKTAKIKKSTLNVGRNAELQEISCIADGSVKMVHFEKWQFLKKINTHIPPSSTPKHLPKQNENICPQKDLHENRHRSIRHNNPKLETTQMSNN